MEGRGSIIRGASDHRGKMLPVDQFHHDRVAFDPVNRRDIRMIERRERLRFARKAQESVCVLREKLRQHLDRDVAIELGVPGAIDLAHPPGAQGGDDLVGAQAAARLQTHGFVSPSAQFNTIVGDCAAAEASCASERMCCPSALTSKISPSASDIKTCGAPNSSVSPGLTGTAARAPSFVT